MENSLILDIESDNDKEIIDLITSDDENEDHEIMDENNENENMEQDKKIGSKKKHIIYDKNLEKYEKTKEGYEKILTESKEELNIILSDVEDTYEISKNNFEVYLEILSGRMGNKKILTTLQDMKKIKNRIMSMSAAEINPIIHDIHLTNLANDDLKDKENLFNKYDFHPYKLLLQKISDQNGLDINDWKLIKYLPDIYDADEIIDEEYFADRILDYKKNVSKIKENESLIRNINRTINDHKKSKSYY